MDALLNMLKPRMTKFIPHSPTPKQSAFLMLPHREALYGGSAGGGKVSYKEDKILTPFGYKATEDLKVGDAICNPDGSHARITWLHPWNTYQVWTVEFHDGSKIDVAEEHLWLVWRSGKKKKVKGKGVFGEDAAEVISTYELKKWLDYAKDQQERGIRPNWPCIPVCQEQHFNVTTRHKNSIDPYLLGILLGDGYIAQQSITITTEDVQHTKNFFDTLSYVYAIDDTSSKAKSFRLKGDSFQYVRHQCRKLGILGKTSKDKFVPKLYKHGSIETRWAILQGLMDTDGTVDERGHLAFCTISEQLAKDVRFIVQSLGGTATISRKEMGKYNDAFILYIKLRNEKQAFRLQRKINRCKKTEDNMYRRVVSVKKTKKVRLGRCLTVSHPNGLYLADDFIVTHNSDALLMAALQYVDIPGYSALLLRKSFAELKQNEALLDRASKWLSPWVKLKECKYIAQNYVYEFKTYNADGSPGVNSKVQFGYIGDDGAKHRYQGAEYQFVGFDEVTHQKEDDYLFLFTRLRKTLCPIHQKRDNEGNPIYHSDCELCQQQKSIPLRVRAATNPGNIGHLWVKERFGIKPVEKDGKTFHIGTVKDRPFIPAYISDNPHIDQKSYIEGLNEVDPITRERLLNGDWSVAEDTKFKVGWVKYYYKRGSHYVLDDRTVPASNVIRLFFTVDPAGSSVQGPGDQLINPKLPKSHTVISVWALTSDYDLLWLHMERFRSEIPEVVNTLLNLYSKWKPSTVLVEKNGLGMGVSQAAARRGIPIMELRTTKDKVVNATEAMNRMAGGKVWFPKEAYWLKDAEDEIFTWQGHPYQPDDIIDTLSNAANYIADEAVASEVTTITYETMSYDSEGDLPSVIELVTDFQSMGYRYPF